MTDMNSLINFDDIDHEIEENGEGGGFDDSPMEKHDNQFLIASAEFKQGNEKSYYVEVIFEIIGELHTKRRIWMNYYLIKKDGTENKVARAIYGKLCKACDLTNEQMNNQMNLVQKMVTGEVIVKKGNMKTDGSGEKYPDGNEVQNFKPIGGVTTAAPAKQEEAAVEEVAAQTYSDKDDNPFG